MGKSGKVVGFGIKMIKYDNLWVTMQEKGISEYRLYTYYGISRQTIYKLRHNELVSLHTINKLCNILDVRIEDVCTFYKDEEEEAISSSILVTNLVDISS